MDRPPRSTISSLADFAGKPRRAACAPAAISSGDLGGRASAVRRSPGRSDRTRGRFLLAEPAPARRGGQRSAPRKSLRLAHAPADVEAGEIGRRERPHGKARTPSSQRRRPGGRRARRAAGARPRWPRPPRCMRLPTKPGDIRPPRTGRSCRSCARPPLQWRAPPANGRRAAHHFEKAHDVGRALKEVHADDPLGPRRFRGGDSIDVEIGTWLVASTAAGPWRCGRARANSCCLDRHVPRNHRLPSRYRRRQPRRDRVVPVMRPRAAPRAPRPRRGVPARRRACGDARATVSRPRRERGIVGLDHVKREWPALAKAHGRCRRPWWPAPITAARRTSLGLTAGDLRKPSRLRASAKKIVAAAPSTPRSQRVREKQRPARAPAPARPGVVSAPRSAFDG